MPAHSSWRLTLVWGGSLLPRLTAVTLACIAGGAHAQDEAVSVDESAVPTYVDVAERGIRTRVDLGGRYVTVGNPDPPVRLEIDDGVNERNDIDLGGAVLFGWDRPFGVPVVADLMGDGFFDVNADSELSPFRDERSNAPRAHLYSAFVGASFAPGELLEPLKLNVGRMTELGESPITYDGGSAGVALRFKELAGRPAWINAKVWGGLDAPQHLANDPFTRTSDRAYAETYVDNSGFISPTGGRQIARAPIDTPILNPVAGFVSDGQIWGIQWIASHTLLPTLQRTKIGAGYALDIDYLMANAMLDVTASDFLPRATHLRADALTWDGTTRVSLNGGFQFFEDICNFDCTFRAFVPAQQFNQGTADEIEALRVRDQIRHLNIGPEQEHLAGQLEVERELPLGFSVLARGRLKQYLDDADLDYFHSNIYEGGFGASWSAGFSLEVGTELVGGLLNNGAQDAAAFDQKAEGQQSYLENRWFVRNVLWDGKLSHLGEVFVRRQDIQTRAILAQGQWSGAVASSLRYDVFDFWSVSMRVDADALSPVDTLNGTGYLGALLGTSLKF